MTRGDRATSPGAQVGVLVVDDYPHNRIALEALLTPIAAITTVDSGERALAEIGRRDFAVVVLDVHMPRMSGVEVARRIRAGSNNAQVPIIFLTAMDSDSAQVLEGYAVGAVDYLRRPFEPVILRSKVAVFVELHERREQAKHEAAERARLEAERAAAERASRQKDRFLAALSHELRTPLTSILLWSDMLLNKPLSGEMSRRGIETIDLCARHEVRLVDNVLEMSRLVTGVTALDRTEVDFGELVGEAVAEIAGLAGERGVNVGCDAQRNRWCGIGDRGRLRHVLYNLLENAVKFTPSGGRADVTLEASDAGLAIRISDTGLGFPADKASTLFERFEQGDATATRLRGGLGMGLALARALVELHGGAITATSDGIGHGATFTITLPDARYDSTAAGDRS
jgi:signal transduction histidine kinase